MVDLREFSLVAFPIPFCGGLLTLALLRKSARKALDALWSKVEEVRNG